jgi:hypothetical protein
MCPETIEEKWRPLDTRALVLEYDPLMLSTEVATRNSSRLSLVRPARPAVQINEPCRVLLAALMLFALISAQDVSAASASAAQGIDVEQYHCKCGTHCRGESCCCGPHKPQTRLPAPDPPPKPDRADDSPCVMNSAPCGDSALPGVPAGGPVGKSAAQAMSGRPQLGTVGFLLLFSTPGLFPSRRASRLDRPPERIIVA